MGMRRDVVQPSDACPPPVAFLLLAFLDLQNLSPGTAEEVKSLAEDLLICSFAEHLYHEWLLQFVK